MRVPYIVLNKAGKVIRHGKCAKEDFEKQAIGDESVIEGMIDDALQKVVNGKVVPKTQEEIEAEKPEEVPEELLVKMVTNREWDALIQRIEKLENERRVNGG